LTSLTPKLNNSSSTRLLECNSSIQHLTLPHAIIELRANCADS
jgi:hypothetical protein